MRAINRLRSCLSAAFSRASFRDVGCLRDSTDCREALDALLERYYFDRELVEAEIERQWNDPKYAERLKHNKFKLLKMLQNVNGGGVTSGLKNVGGGAGGMNIKDVLLRGHGGAGGSRKQLSAKETQGMMLREVVAAKRGGPVNLFDVDAGLDGEVDEDFQLFPPVVDAYLRADEDDAAVDLNEEGLLEQVDLVGEGSFENVPPFH